MRSRTTIAVKCGLGLVTLGLIGHNAQAADETGKWYINPMYGYSWLDDALGVDDDHHFSLGFGKHLSEHWSIELNALKADFDGHPNVDLDQEALSLDALWVFGRANRFSPYITFGGGYIDNDYKPGRNASGPLAQAGIGAMIDVAENDSGTFVFQLRPEAKLRYEFTDNGPHDSYHDYLVNLGFAFNFGPAPYHAPAPTPVAYTPPPPPEPKPPPPPAPKDSDGDGVLDPQDRCPDTPRGTAVDAVGCPLKGSVTLQGIAFEFNSATLTGDSRPVLDKVAEDLKKHPRFKIELQGHTDSVGSDAYNLKLSQQRADAVRNYLTSQGVAAGQLTSKGYGESQPVASNKTDAGRAENRRVVMAVLDNPGDVPVKGEQEITPQN